MIRFVARRIVATLPVLLVVALTVFLLLHLTPGDPAAVMAGDHAAPEDIARIRTRLGLDQPIYLQFAWWIGRLLVGDLGQSIFSNLPVATLILQRLEPTVSLAATTLLGSLPIAIAAGVLAAARSGGVIDRVVMLFAVLGFSLPVFVLGYCLVYLFALQWQLVPVQGFVSIRAGLWPFLRSMALPAATLGIVYVALIARITRASVLEVLSHDFIRTARAKGVNEVTLLLRHALRNAAVPIVTMIGISVALLLSGSIIVESVFNLPGVGRLLMDAVLKRDYPVIQGVVLVFSCVYVLVNLVIDILYAMLDPRIRY